MLENAIFTKLSLATSFNALTSFFAFFKMLQLFCKSLVTVWIATMSKFLRIAGLIWSIRYSVDATGSGRILTESPQDTSLPLTFFIIEFPMTMMFSFTFGWWASAWRSLKLTCSSLNSSFFGTFDSFLLSFRKILFPVVWLILLSFDFPFVFLAWITNIFNEIFIMKYFFNAHVATFFVKHVLKEVSGLWNLNSGRWTLDSGRYTLDAGLWTLDTVIDCCRTESESSFWFCFIKLLKILWVQIFRGLMVTLVLWRLQVLTWIFLEILY